MTAGGLTEAVTIRLGGPYRGVLVRSYRAQQPDSGGRGLGGRCMSKFSSIRISPPLPIFF